MVKSKEREVFTGKDLTEEINDSLFIDLMMEERLIGSEFLERIEETMHSDSEMWLVFSSLLEGLKPADIENKYGIQIEKVRNIQKRLRRHIKNITDL